MSRVCVCLCACAHYTNSMNIPGQLNHNTTGGKNVSTCRLISLKFITITSNGSLMLTSSQNIFPWSSYFATLLEGYFIFYSLTANSVFQHLLPNPHSQLMILLPVSLRRLKQSEENFHSSHPPPGICTHVF